MRSMAVMAVQGKEFGAAAVDGLNSQNSLELAAQVAKEVKAKCEGVNKVYCLTSGLGLCVIRSSKVLKASSAPMCQSLRRPGGGALL